MARLCFSIFGLLGCAHIPRHRAGGAERSVLSISSRAILSSLLTSPTDLASRPSPANVRLGHSAVITIGPITTLQEGRLRSVMLSLDAPVTIFCAGLVFAAAAICGLWSRKHRNRFPLPPGPRKLPLVGNLWDLPTTFQWETYARWSKEFSACLYRRYFPTNSFPLISRSRFGYHLREFIGDVGDCAVVLGGYGCSLRKAVFDLLG